MKRNTHSNHVRQETAAAADSSRQDRRSFVNTVKHFFGENGQPEFGSAKETILLQACERFLEYNGRSSHL